MENETKYTREERLNDLNTLIYVLPIEASTRSALIKQIAMVRVNDMEEAWLVGNILNIQMNIMDGAAYGKIA